jgi:RNA-directed DNA polymerase
MMEKVVEKENIRRAYERVVNNKGAPGVDGMTVEELGSYLKKEWIRIRQDLLEDRYQPQAVREQRIPKPDGGERLLGIPTVVDRMIGQALHQVMEPVFDPEFSKSSYGFRQGKNAHQAILKSREYITEGYVWIVDIDLEKFFDRVNHDILMSRIARKIKDKRVLRLLRRYLQAGIMTDGLTSMRSEGTPQGSPLSPLLSNIMLDDLDKEFESRGHRFCRYADDANIYVRTERAGQRVMSSVRKFLEKRLKLKVNDKKSKVGKAQNVKFLGYTTIGWKNPRLKPAKESVKRFKDRMRKIFQRGRGRKIRNVIWELNPVIRGWTNYFKLSDVNRVFESLDEWIRRKLRGIQWRQWKKRYRRAQNLIKGKVNANLAWETVFQNYGPWRNAGSEAMNMAVRKEYFDRLGLISLLRTIQNVQPLLPL